MKWQVLLSLIGALCGILLSQPGYAEKLNCLEQCFLEHQDWKHPHCFKTSENFIQGPACYELYQACRQSCSDQRQQLPLQYIVAAGQSEDLWIPGDLCSSALTKIPVRPLSSNFLIHSEWSGHCECLNGRLIELSCGHAEVSCQQACNDGKLY